MQNDPLVEWQRLTETYGKMYDAELLELAASKDDLTEQAQQVLSDEMRKRGLSLAQTAGAQAGRSDWGRGKAFAGPEADVEGSELDADPADGPGGEARPVDYTWKTVLCECETTDQAWQLATALQKVGIENWVEGQNTSSPFGGKDVRYARVIVPADRLEEAREVAARPIPKEIVEDLETPVPEFELPVCPKCGAGDPLLEGVDPVNTWLCEACEHEWSETTEGE